MPHWLPLCLRLLRRGLIDADFAAQSRSQFAADLTGALWAMRPFEVASFGRATSLLRDSGAPLATLDAELRKAAKKVGVECWPQRI